MAHPIGYVSSSSGQNLFGYISGSTTATSVTPIYTTPTVEYLVIAGGGGGGLGATGHSRWQGGGGAGGVGGVGRSEEHTSELPVT